MTDLQQELKRLEELHKKFFAFGRNLIQDDTTDYATLITAICAVRREMREEVEDDERREIIADAVAGGIEKATPPPAEPSYCQCPPDQQHLNGKFCEFCTKMVEPKIGEIDFEACENCGKHVGAFENHTCYTPAAKECEHEDRIFYSHAKDFCKQCEQVVPALKRPHPPEDKDG